MRDIFYTPCQVSNGKHNVTVNFLVQVKSGVKCYADHRWSPRNSMRYSLYCQQRIPTCGMPDSVTGDFLKAVPYSSVDILRLDDTLVRLVAAR